MKEFLSHKGVPFVDKNVITDPAAMDELIALGYRSTPIITIDSDIVVGFDRGKIQRLLGLR